MKRASFILNPNSPKGIAPLRVFGTEKMATVKVDENNCLYLESTGGNRIVCRRPVCLENVK